MRLQTGRNWSHSDSSGKSPAPHRPTTATNGDSPSARRPVCAGLMHWHWHWKVPGGLQIGPGNISLARAFHPTTKPRCVWVEIPIDGWLTMAVGGGDGQRLLSLVTCLLSLVTCLLSFVLFCFVLFFPFLMFFVFFSFFCLLFSFFCFLFSVFFCFLLFLISSRFSLFLFPPTTPSSNGCAGDDGDGDGDGDMTVT